jgi:hypothetical protein
MSSRVGIEVRVLVAVAMAAVAGVACVGDAPGPPSPDGGTGGTGGTTPGTGGTGGTAGAGPGGATSTGGTAGSGTGGTAGSGTGGTAGSGTGGTAGAAGVNGTIVRTYAYHQVTTLATRPTGPSIISADGSKIVYPIAPGTGDPASPNKIFVVNPDGTGTVEVDSYVPGCFCGAKIDVSANGQTVVSSDATQVRVVGADASKKGSLKFDSNEIWDVKISADGSTVFMIQRRDNNVTGGARVERGLWAMNADGTNLRQLVGPAGLVPMLAVSMPNITMPEQVFPFAGCGKSLDYAADGRHGVFVVQAGSKQFPVIVDGTATRLINRPADNIKQVAISANGQWIAVWSQTGAAEETVIMSGDGGPARVITTLSHGSCFSPMTLNADGSQLLFGDTGMMYPTAGGDPITLGLNTGGDGIAIGAPCCDVAPSFSMNGAAKRFSYLNSDSMVVQIGLLELDPTALGVSPTLASPTFSTGSIPRDRSVGARVKCRITAGAGAPLVRAGTAVLLKGVEDRAGSWLAGSHVMRDDGMKDDTAAGDGNFISDAAITSGTGGDVGPRLVRIKAEAKAADGRRHATAVDVSGLEVK